MTIVSCDPGSTAPVERRARPRQSARRYRRPLLAWLVGVLFASQALAAPGVFLNGVNIDGVTGQTFEKVTVVIDDEGNILITAPGYQVQTVNPKPSAAPAPAKAGPVQRRYFLVSEANPPGMAEYDIDVFINSVWVKRISHEEPQNVIEVSKYLRKGKNLVLFSATKVRTGQRKSAARGHYVKIILGEGNMGGNQVMIDNPLLEYARNASETRNFSDEFTVTGR